VSLEDRFNRLFQLSVLVFLSQQTLLVIEGAAR
jgi:hypothetical protein